MHLLQMPFRKNPSWLMSKWLPLIAALSSMVNIKADSQSYQKPNVVVIVADDLGWHDVGWNSAQFNATPHLTKLARQGVILDRYYVQPLCTPTRSALLTGRYPIRNGMQRHVILPATRNGLPLTERLLPQYLKESAYATHMIGKWHLGSFAKEYLPWNRGFDSFYGGHEAGSDYWDYSYNATRFQNKTRFEGFDLHDNDKPVLDKFGIHHTDMVTEQAIARIHRHRAQSQKPLFLYVAYHAPHSSTTGVDRPDQAMQVPQIYENQQLWIADRKRRQAVAMIKQLDHGIGQIYEALKSSGLMNNTVIIFTVDNGGSPALRVQTAGGPNHSYNWPLRGQKGTLWEGGVHVPSFIHSPLLQNPGRRYNHLVHVTDWLPTIVHLAGGPESFLNLDGHNVWKAINDDCASSRKEILLNIDSGMTSTHMTVNDKVSSALIYGRWKIIKGQKANTFDSWYRPPETSEKDIKTSISCPLIPPQVPSTCDSNACVFDVLADPCETTDVSSLYPLLTSNLMARLNFYYNSTVPPLYNERFEVSANPLHRNMFWEPWVKL